jgi:hypothetical protein
MDASMLCVLPSNLPRGTARDGGRRHNRHSSQFTVVHHPSVDHVSLRYIIRTSPELNKPVILSLHPPHNSQLLAATSQLFPPRSHLITSIPHTRTSYRREPQRVHMHGRIPRRRHPDHNRHVALQRNHTTGHHPLPRQR